jgi:hypothetical protein
MTAPRYDRDQSWVSDGYRADPSGAGDYGWTCRSFFVSNGRCQAPEHECQALPQCGTRNSECGIEKQGRSTVRNAECGMRNAGDKIPHPEFRIPHWS